MRNRERKILTARNMFYNTLAARQALRRHRRESHRRSHADDAHAADIPDATTSTTLTSRRC
jgi:hypothetical protein